MFVERFSVENLDSKLEGMDGGELREPAAQEGGPA